MQSQWFGGNGQQLYAGLRGERDGGVGGAYSPSLGGIVPFSSRRSQLKLNAATAFRAPTAEELYYPGFSNPNLAPERTRVGDATLVAPTLWGGVSFGWFMTSGSNLIVSPPPLLHSGERRPCVDRRVSRSQRRRRAWRGLVADLDVTNLYRAQNLDTDARLPGRGPVFAVTLGLKFVPARRRAAFDGFAHRCAHAGAAGERRSVPVAGVRASISRRRLPTWTRYAGYRLAPRTPRRAARLQSRQRPLRALRGISDARAARSPSRCAAGEEHAASSSLLAALAVGAGGASLLVGGTPLSFAARSPARSSHPHARGVAATRSSGSCACRASASPRRSARRLALCGAMLQGMLRNPLVDPYLTGVSAAAAAAIAIAILAGVAAAAHAGNRLRRRVSARRCSSRRSRAAAAASTRTA